MLSELRDTIAFIFQNLHLNKIFCFTFRSVLRSVYNNIILAQKKKKLSYDGVEGFPFICRFWLLPQWKCILWSKTKEINITSKKLSGRKNVSPNQAWITFLLMSNTIFLRGFIFFTIFLLTSKKASKHPNYFLLIAFPLPYYYCLLL